MLLNKLQDSDLLHQACYIDGAWCDAENNATLKVLNPATGEVLGIVPAMGKTETCRAIEAANKAWEGWRDKTAQNARSRTCFGRGGRDM